MEGQEVSDNVRDEVEDGVDSSYLPHHSPKTEQPRRMTKYVTIDYFHL